MKGTEIVASQEIGETENWTYEFDNLAEFENGNAIVYHVEEVAVPGYEAQIDGYNITNKHVPATIRIEGTKTWDDANNQDGLRPKTITVNLMKGTEIVASQEIGETENWTYVFENLAEFENGNAIVYHVEEVAVPGYETQIDGYNITNKHVPTLPNTGINTSSVGSTLIAFGSALIIFCMRKKYKFESSVK